MKKKMVSVAASLMLAVGFVSPCVQNFSASAVLSMGDRENWSSYADTSWYTGDKSSYDISTPEQLAGLSVLVAEGNSMCNTVINLTADIALGDTSNYADWKATETIPADLKIWKPIGSPVGSAISGYIPFTGIFNGNGHTISGMYAVTGDSSGLFGYVYGGEIYDVIVSESYSVAMSETENAYAGGIVGLMEKSVVNNCEFDGRIYAATSTLPFGGYHTSSGGGIVGAVVPNNVTDIIGTIAVEGIFMAGGYILNPLILNNGSGKNIDQWGIYNCISQGEILVEGFGDNISGGIIGESDNTLISNCYSDFRTLSSDPSVLYGEIAGNLMNTPVQNCYYSGENESVGGKSPNDDTIEAYRFEKGSAGSYEVAEKVSNAFFVNDDKMCLRSDKKLVDNAYDINGDGKFSIADLVVMQRWILSYPDTKIADWHSADIDRDKILDVYDMMSLKKLFLENKA